MVSKNLYDLLEVPSSATPEEIKESYRLIVSMLHPDKFPQGSKQWLRAHEKIQELNKAYEILKNPEQRFGYDAETFDQNTAHRQAQASPPNTDRSTSPPQSTPEKPSPVASKSRTETKTGIVVLGVVGIGCIAAILVNVVLDTDNGLGTYLYLYLAGLGVLCLWIAFCLRKK